MSPETIKCMLLGCLRSVQLRDLLQYRERVRRRRLAHNLWWLVTVTDSQSVTCAYSTLQSSIRPTKLNDAFDIAARIQNPNLT